jgi:micrococcal nuclease
MKLSSLLKLSSVFVVLFINGCSEIAANAGESFKEGSQVMEVIKVTDGDTIVADFQGEKKKLRLCGIDAPEKKQALGRESKNNLENLVSSKKIMVYPVETDKYNRTVAEVFIADGKGGEKFINEEQVKSGLAYEYKRYSGNCPNKLAIGNAEKIAQGKKLGIWNGIHEKPWDYRKNQRNQRNQKANTDVKAGLFASAFLGIPSLGIVLFGVSQ